MLLKTGGTSPEPARQVEHAAFFVGRVLETDVAAVYAFKEVSNTRSALERIACEHVIKLLSFIEPEEQIGRGTLGQSVEAIISSLPKAATMLREVVGSREIDMQLREYAGLILAMNEGPNALSELSMLEREGSWYAGEIAKHIKDYGGINPYA